MEELVSELHNFLRKRNATFATVESCTGGMLGAAVTSVSGSSDCYLGGVIAYADRIKRSLLSVSEASLEQYGAVSELVAKQMASSVRKQFQSDFSLSVTGIAGPGGGTEEKPVGLVYIGCAGPEGLQVVREVFDGDRKQVRKQTVIRSLNILLHSELEE